MARFFAPAPANASSIIPGLAFGGPPMGDVVDRLNAAPHGREALHQFRQESQDAGNLLRPLLEEEDDVRRERYLLEARRKHLLTPKAAGGAGLEEDATSVVDIVTKIAALDDRRRRIATLIEDRRALSRNAAALLTNAETWLRSGVPGGVAVVDHAEIDLRDAQRKGETTLAAIDRHRLRLREIDADHRRIEHAPQTRAEALAQMRTEVEQLASRGEVSVDALVEAALPLTFPTNTQRSALAAVVGATGQQIAGSALAETIDTQALIAWLFKDLLIKKLEAEIVAISDDTNALSKKARQEQLAALDQEKLDISRREVALVRRARAEGHVVGYRVDTDVRALLGVALQVVTAEGRAE